MATGRVQAGFFHTRTRPAGQDPRPGPGPFTKRIFFRGPDPPRRAPRAPRAPLGRGTSGPILWPNQKKKCLPNIDFLSNQTGGEKEYSRKPIIFSATNRSETLFFSLQYFPTSKAKTRINIQTLGLNNKTLQNQIKQVDPIQPK